MQIDDSNNISILGSSGHYGLKADGAHMAIISISNSPNVEFMMLSRQLQPKELEGGFWISNGKDRIYDDFTSILWYKR